MLARAALVAAISAASSGVFSPDPALVSTIW